MMTKKQNEYKKIMLWLPCRTECRSRIEASASVIMFAGGLENGGAAPKVDGERAAQDKRK